MGWTPLSIRVACKSWNALKESLNLLKMPVTAVFRFGRCEVRPAERRLLVDGVPASLGARAYDVLLWLLEHRDRLVTKRELLDAAWPGLVVEENNLSVQISALRKVLGTAAIATVVGRGFRFAAEVQEEASTAVPSPVASDLSTSTGVAPPFDRPAIAVLPFSVLSGDPADAFLCDGLVADITALLARVPGFLLISRASSFVFRDRAGDLSEVARQLGVRYLVEGSLRGQGATLRVSTQLIDATHGHILWNGEFSSSRDEAQDLQTGVARGVIAQLQPELTRAEIGQIRRQRPDNLTAWAHYHRGIDAIASHGWSESALEAARSHLSDAIRVDPEFGLAHAHHAVLTALGAHLGLLPPREGMQGEIVASVEEAVRLDGRSAEVLGYAGCALSDLGCHERAIEMLREALDIDPSNAQASVSLGAALVQSGDMDAGIRLMRFGMQISPRDRRLAFWGWTLAEFLLRGERVTEALSEARTAEQRDPRFYLARIVEAGAQARLGRVEQAQAALCRARQLRPALSLEEVCRAHGSRVADQLRPLWDAADPIRPGGGQSMRKPESA
jgi:TolB-like protein